MRFAGLITVVETPEFRAASSGLFDEDERTLLISYLAAHPLAGDLMAGTGGVRKLRWGIAGHCRALPGVASGAERALSTTSIASACLCSCSPPMPRTCERT